MSARKLRRSNVMIGAKLAPYEITGRLGSGGMGGETSRDSHPAEQRMASDGESVWT
jgi:hypothetical protein